MQANRPLSLPPNPTGKADAGPYGNIGFNYYSAKSSRSNSTFDQRLIAITLDFLFLMILVKLMQAITFVEDGDRVPAGILTLVYFVWTHWWFGCTLGKYFVGLRLEFEYPRTARGFFRILVRETLGKTISFLPLCLGFLWVLFSKRRLAWHDQLCQMRTVTLKPRSTSVAAQLWRGLFLIGGLSLGAAVVGLVIFMTTITPLENLQQRLVWSGIHLSGLHGSLIDGYVVDRVQWKKDQSEIELKDLTVQIDPWSLLSLRGGLRLEAVSISHGSVYWRSEAAEEEALLSDDESILDALPDFMARVFDLNQVDIADVKLDIDGRKLDIERLFISGFSSRPEEFRFERIYVESSLFHVNLNNFGIENGEIKMQSPMQGYLKPAISADLLQRDVSFSVLASGSYDDPNVDAKIFNSQLRVMKKDSGVHIELQDASPSNYLQGHWPVSRVTVSLDGPMPDWIDWTVTGQFLLRNSILQIHEGQTVGSLINDGLRTKSSDGLYDLTFYPQYFKSGQSWLAVRHRGELLSTHGGLSRLYTDNARSEKEAISSAALQYDTHFFAKSFFDLEKVEKGPAVDRETPLTLSAPASVSEALKESMMSSEPMPQVEATVPEPEIETQEVTDQKKPIETSDEQVSDADEDEPVDDQSRRLPASEDDVQDPPEDSF